MSYLAKLTSVCSQRRLAQLSLHVTETGEVAEFLQRLLSGLELLQKFGRHIVDDRGDVFDDADLGALFQQFGDYKMRLGLPIEQIIVGFQRPQAAHDLGPELSGLACQDDIHRNSLSSSAAPDHSAERILRHRRRWWFARNPVLLKFYIVVDPKLANQAIAFVQPGTQPLLFLP